MRTMVLGALPPELDVVLARRRQNGQDLFDEVWNGEYHMAPAPSGGHAYIDHQLARLVSPPDESYGKDSFYAAAGVEELLIVDPLRRTVELHNLISGDLRARSEVLDTDLGELANALDWPDLV